MSYVFLIFVLSSTLYAGRLAGVGYSAVWSGRTWQEVMPAMRWMALVKSYHDMTPSSFLNGRHDDAGQVTGIGGGSDLVEDDT